MKMSLVYRITLPIVGVLVLAFGTTGIALYGRVKRSQELKAEKALEIRLAWIESSLVLNDTRLSLSKSPEPNDGAEGWRVATLEGQMLWGSGAISSDGEVLIKSRKKSLYTNPSSRDARARGAGEWPKSALEDGHPSFIVPPGAVLAISASVPAGEMHAELSRLLWALWTVGPLALILLSGAIYFLVRTQLMPVRQIAHTAAGIGPGNTNSRIQTETSSPECEQLALSINGMLERLAGALERERQFSNDAAHELRTPLAAIKLQVEVALRRSRPQAEYEAALRDIDQNIDRLLTVVTGLLDLTRQDLDDASRSCVPVGEVLREAGGFDGALKILCPVSGLQELKVRGRKDLIGAALRNIVENALKYAPGAPPVLEVYDGHDSIHFAVSDSGPGIAETERTNIFKPLVRLDNSRCEGGFGLGLAIAHKAVRACGGELTCGDRRDRAPGAEFVIKLLKYA